MFDKYERFKICLTSVGTAIPNPVLSNDNRMVTINMEGLQWNNQSYNTQLGVISSNVIITSAGFSTNVGITLNYTGEDLIGFKLSLNNPSKIAELQELEQWRTRFDVAGAATEGFFSRRWLAEKMFGMSHDEYERNQFELFHDQKFDARINSVEDSEGPGALGGFDSPGPGGQGSDILDLGEPEDSGDEMPSSKEERGEEGDLIVDPDSEPKGRRMDASHQPVEHDARKHGARRRHLSSLAGGSLASSASRNIMKGRSELGSLARGITESRKESFDNYFETKKALGESQKKIRDGEKIIKEIDRKFKGSYEN
jgi:hypothetical protein